jgi:hypothetical protein
VCHQVVKSNSASEGLLRLNHLFVEKCLEAFQAFEEGDFSPPRLSWLWVQIYDDWLLEQESGTDSGFSILLGRMAGVHILEDLENVLFYADVNKKEYDAVFDLIVECVDRLRIQYCPSLSIKEQIVDCLIHELAVEARNWTLEELREIAWQSALRRKRLMSRSLTLKAARNLERWYDSGFPEQWVQDHHGEWNDKTWLSLVDELKRTEFWPMEKDDIGRLLEALKKSYQERKGM